MSFENWPLPRFEIKADDVSLWNAAMSRAGQPLPLTGGASVTFTPRVGLPAPGVLTSVLFGDEVRAYIGIEEFPFGRLSGADLSVSDLRDMPEDLAGALRRGMIQTILDTLQSEIGTGFDIGADVVLGDVEAAEQVQDLSWFEIALRREPEEKTVFFIGIAPNAICRELAGRVPEADKVGAELGRMIPIQVERLVGTAELMWVEICELAPGDCILISEAAAADQLTVIASDRVFAFEEVDEGWSCAKTVPLKQLLFKSRDAGETLLDNCESALPEFLEEVGKFVPEAPLKIGLSFRLGSANLSATEIANWRPGAFANLPDSLNESNTEVKVVANDTTIAQGDLVRVGDRVGVRLSRIFFNT